MAVDRYNPQSVMGGDRRRARILDQGLRDGLPLAGRRQITHKALDVPASAGPQPRQRMAYDLAPALARAQTQPPGFSARLRAINQGIGD